MKKSRGNWQALQKRKIFHHELQILYTLRRTSNLHSVLGLDGILIQNAINRIQATYYGSCKTFTVCPTCDKALTNKIRRKAAKALTHSDCNICENYTEQNRIIHHTETLEEARITIQQTHPELFV